MSSTASASATVPTKAPEASTASPISAIVRLYLRQLTPAYLVAGIAFLANLIVTIVFLCLPVVEDNSNTSTGNMAALVVLMAAIFIPSLNVRKSLNLGARRIDIFRGCIPVYAILSAGAAVVMVAYRLAIDPLLVASGKFAQVQDMGTALGFYQHGPIVAIFQYFAFLILVAAFVHTLTMAQTAWYGWVADVVLIAVISVFTPIAPLRAAEAWFFHLIIFSTPVVQILVSLVGAAVLYAISLPILNHKRI